MAQVVVEEVLLLLLLLLLLAAGVASSNDSSTPKTRTCFARALARAAAVEEEVRVSFSSFLLPSGESS